MQLDRLEIRERRFRLQQQIAELGEDGDTHSLDAEVTHLQEICPRHEVEGEERHLGWEINKDGDLWRCRDCDLKGEIAGAETDVEEPADAAAAEPADSAAADNSVAASSD